MALDSDPRSARSNSADSMPIPDLGILPGDLSNTFHGQHHRLYPRGCPGAQPDRARSPGHRRRIPPANSSCKVGHPHDAMVTLPLRWPNWRRVQDRPVLTDTASSPRRQRSSNKQSSRFGRRRWKRARIDLEWASVKLPERPGREVPSYQNGDELRVPVPDPDDDQPCRSVVRVPGAVSSFAREVVDDESAAYSSGQAPGDREPG
jgi:hypothetical protein